MDRPLTKRPGIDRIQVPIKVTLVIDIPEQKVANYQEMINYLVSAVSVGNPNGHFRRFFECELVRIEWEPLPPRVL